MYNIHLLPASFGDSILIEYGNTSPKYILIDGGPYFNYKEILPAIERVAPSCKKLELLIVTHVDIDHIDGVIILLNSKTLPFTIEEIWFNGYDQLAKMDDELGALQGEYLTELIHRHLQAKHNLSFQHQAVVVKDFDNLPVIKLADGMQIQLLGPGVQALKNLKTIWEEEVLKKIGTATVAARLADDNRYLPEDDLLGGLEIDMLQDMKVKGDKSIANQSSIAFIANFMGKSCLFAGDATTDGLLEAIEPMLAKQGKMKLKLDAWKLSHHGSNKSTLDILMQKIECNQILISTDGKRYEHPGEASIAKLLKHNGPGLTFYFNYFTKFNKRWSDDALMQQYSFTSLYPEDENVNGITLKLM